MQELIYKHFNKVIICLQFIHFNHLFNVNEVLSKSIFLVNSWLNMILD